jgi:uncharacterized protein (TIGR03085 family)
MTNFAQAERRQLADLLVEVGPDQPTLCGEWTTRDLAAHLVIRERRPDASIGLVVKPLEDRLERVRLEAAAEPWPELVDDVRGGPPKWSPMRIQFVDQLANTVEFFVHHEDVRRAADTWEPRELDPALVEELWKTLSRMGRMVARKAPCGLVLVDPAGRRAVVKKGEPTVTVSGPVGELVMFSYGRQAKSRVELTGPDDLVEAVRTAPLGG